MWFSISWMEPWMSMALIFFLQILAAAPHDAKEVTYWSKTFTRFLFVYISSPGCGHSKDTQNLHALSSTLSWLVDVIDMYPSWWWGSLIISNFWAVEDQSDKWMGKLDDWKRGRLIRSGDGWLVETDFHALTLSCLSSSSLASLIRGQVLTTDGTPLVGVNVSFVNYPHYGYTLTRQDGMYVQ